MKLPQDDKRKSESIQRTGLQTNHIGAFECTLRTKIYRISRCWMRNFESLCVILGHLTANKIIRHGRQWSVAVHLSDESPPRMKSH